MKIFRSAFIALVLGCAAASALAAEPRRLDFQVICEDKELAQRVEAGIRQRLQKANVDVSSKFPSAKLFIYLQRDVNDRKNSDGVSVAIAHVSNAMAVRLALDHVQRKQDMPPVLQAMLQEEGMMRYLNVAHMDEASDQKLAIVLDAALATFLAKTGAQ